MNSRIRFLNILFIFICILISALPVFSSLEKIDGLEYDVRLIEDAPIQAAVSKRFDLYEIYFENRSEKTFSIPGYSIDLGVSYSNLAEVDSTFKDKSKRKLAVLNLAAGAASIALGGIARSATNAAMRTVGSFKRNNLNIADNSSFLAPGRVYIIYPGDGLSLFLFVDKFLYQPPNIIRFICKEEDSATNHIVINNKLKIREINNNNLKDENEVDEKKDNLEKDDSKDIIAAPETNLYK